MRHNSIAIVLQVSKLVCTKPLQNESNEFIASRYAVDWSFLGGYRPPVNSLTSRFVLVNIGMEVMSLVTFLLIICIFCLCVCRWITATKRAGNNRKSFDKVCNSQLV